MVIRSLSNKTVANIDGVPPTKIEISG